MTYNRLVRVRDEHAQHNSRAQLDDPGSHEVIKAIHHIRLSATGSNVFRARDALFHKAKQFGPAPGVQPPSGERYNAASRRG